MMTAVRAARQVAGLLSAAALVLAIAACARNQAVFLKQDVSQAQVDLDLSACRQGADAGTTQVAERGTGAQLAWVAAFSQGFSSGMVSGAADASARRAAIISCMNRKGYAFKTLSDEDSKRYEDLKTADEKDAFLRAIYQKSTAGN